MKNQIEPRHRQEMADQGFTVFKDVFSSAEIQNLDKALLTFLAATKRDDREREVDFGQKAAERSDAIREFATQPFFQDLSTAFLGPDTDLYFNQMIYKNPGGSKAFSWHQDDAYGPVEPSPYLTTWIAISDVNEENGCLSFLPGSYQRGLVDHWESDFGLACHRNDDPDQGVPLPAKSGSIVAFWSTTIHMSFPNTTDQVRKAFSLQFSPVGMRHKASGMTIRSRIQVARKEVT